VRGIGEIDLGRPRWNDEPAHVFQVLKSYLEIDPEKSPAAVFHSGVGKASRAEQELSEACLHTKSGRFKARLVKIMAYRLRQLGGLRETPKFTVIRLLGNMRMSLLAAGQKLVDAGVLTHADDVLFLHLGELKTLGGSQAGNWITLIGERRATYEREMRRKRIPRIMLSDGTALFDLPLLPGEDDKNNLAGSPVSAGIVEGVVRVVIDPRGVQLTPGEILVCPATDPAWTPLFLTAGGLVMEVGGMMTHGSVVAREYGIPAVVGVRQATERLRTGQRVRLDGSSGNITILSK
jgi:rifampicin phosphotransferase